jgi:ubiquinone biosynthesis protein
VLCELARIAEGRTVWGRLYSLSAVAEQFERELHEQLDYGVEARHAEHIRSTLAADPEVLVPRVHWTCSSARVLTVEYIEGTRLSDVIAESESPEGRRRLAVVLARAMLRQAFRDGVYHADPHPGNLLLAPDGRLALMDFGLVGFLDERMRAALAGLSLGLVQRDAEEVVLSLQDLGVAPSAVARRPLQRDVEYLLLQYGDRQLDAIPFAGMVQDVLTLARKYGLQIPPELGQFVRTLFTLEGVIRQLDGSLSLVELAEPVVQELAQERFAFDRMAGDVRRSTLLAARQVTRLPAQARAFLQRLEGGQLPIVVEQGDFEGNLRQVGRLVNRVVVALLAASLLLLAGLLIGLDAGPQWQGLSILGLILLATGLAGAAWVLAAVVRGGRV